MRKYLPPLNPDKLTIKELIEADYFTRGVKTRSLYFEDDLWANVKAEASRLEVPISRIIASAVSTYFELSITDSIVKPRGQVKPRSVPLCQFIFDTIADEADVKRVAYS